MKILREEKGSGVFCRVQAFVFGILLNCNLFLAAGRGPTQLRKALTVDYFENCEQKVYPVRTNFSFARNGSLIIINGEEIIERDSKDIISILFRIEKCKDKSNPDTCEYYTTWKFDNFCGLKVMPFYSLVMEAHTPPMTCPLKKGRYAVKDAKIESGLVAQFLGRGESSRVLWKYHIVMRENNQPITCINLGFRIVDVRIRH
nr:PREDICTED: uncharacterized protein LOC109038836 [Bemisia tabaci]